MILNAPAPVSAVRIWDPLIRLIHWLMVLLVGVSWWTGENGELDYHRYSGYALLGLLVLRVFWGFFGSHSARFASFVKGPRAIAAYLRQLPARTAHTPAVPGHNPLGALSVIALLLAMATQVALGLFAVDVDGIESGPLSHLVSFDTGRTCAKLHHQLFDVLLALIALHVASVLFYLFYKRDNLIATMVHGRRALPAGSNDVRVPTGALVVGIALAAAVVWWIATA